MSIYDYTVKDRKGNDVSIANFKGRVLLVVNTATGCGFTPQYEGLEKLYEAYNEQGFKGFDLKGKILIPIVKKMDPNYATSSDVKWNFTKFLVDREGNVVERFESTVEPKKIDEKIASII